MTDHPSFKRARATAKAWLEDHGANAVDLDNLARAMLVDYDRPVVDGVDCMYFFKGHECNVGERRLALWMERYDKEGATLRRCGFLCEDCQASLKAEQLP
jgi:hypothetical protein